MAKPPTVEPHIERPGPAEFRDPIVRREMQKAAVWLGMALAIVGVVVLAQPLLLIVGGAIFAVFLDGGVRLLGRYLPIPRGWRLLLVLLLGFGFIGWVIWFAGTTIGAQFEALREVVTAQFDRLVHFVASLGLIPKGQPADVGSQLLGGIGRLTSAVGSAIGAVTSVVAMIVIGIFLAAEPRIYDRGIAWMLPLRARAGFYRIAEHVGFTLRRLLFGRLVGMIFEGIFTWAMLSIGGVPMAALLGLVTGVLAFIPNIGAITSGVLMVAVGFSAGAHQGVFAIFVYFFVQNIDGYLVVPYIARRTVDLPPALVLAMQLLMGALLGILGVLFADPILATLKVVLIDLSKQRADKENEGPEIVSGEGVTVAAPAAASAASSRRRRGRSSAP
jgi:predicted PurR-regulated permease PerM